MSTWKEKFGEDIEWKTGGYLFPIYTDQIGTALKSLLPTQQKYGLEIDFVDKEKVKQLVPGINEEGLQGGIFSPNDGCAAPYLAAQAFYKRAVNAGVSFFFNQQCVSFILENE